jgi:glycosyltransferase involved in cell wall biosynthesis
MKKITILIPCHNEEKGLAKVLDGLSQPTLTRYGYDVEVVVIDNNSTDATARIAQEKGARVIFESQQGKGRALITGFKAVSDDTDFVVMLDGDNTYKLSELVRLVEPLESDFGDVIIGSRLAGKTHEGSLKFKNRLANWFYTFMVRQFYLANVTDVLSGYFAWKKSAVDALLPHLQADGFAIEMEMITKMVRLGLKIYSVPITYDTREGETKIDILRDGLRILRMFLKNLFWVPRTILNQFPAQPDKKHVVMIVSYTYPFTGSGLGNVAKLQAETLAKRGYGVSLISSNVPPTRRMFMHNDVRHVKLAGLHFLNKLHVPLPLSIFSVPAIRAIKSADVVHVHDALYPSSVVSVLLAKIFRKPITLTQHVPFISYPSSWLNMLQKIAYGTLGTFVFSQAHKITVLNESVKAMLHRYAEKVTLIPNGVDTEFFKPSLSTEYTHTLREKYSLPLDKPIVLYVGRLVPKKGFDLVYAARDSDYLTLCVGDGTLPAQLVPDENIIFMGKQDQATLKELYQLSDMFVLPSYGEGFPLVIQEAMACGLPIVTTRHTDYVQYVDESYVQLVDRDIPEIKAAIRKVLTDKNLQSQMRAYSRRRALEMFSWEEHSAQIEKIYSQLLDPSADLMGVMAE